jgi:hypothetical protein
MQVLSFGYDSLRMECGMVGGMRFLSFLRPYLYLEPAVVAVNKALNASEAEVAEAGEKADADLVRVEKMTARRCMVIVRIASKWGARVMALEGLGRIRLVAELLERMLDMPTESEAILRCGVRMLNTEVTLAEASAMAGEPIHMTLGEGGGMPITLCQSEEEADTPGIFAFPENDSRSGGIVEALGSLLESLSRNVSEIEAATGRLRLFEEDGQLSLIAVL